MCLQRWRFPGVKRLGGPHPQPQPQGISRLENSSNLMRQQLFSYSSATQHRIHSTRIPIVDGLSVQLYFSHGHEGFQLTTALALESLFSLAARHTRKGRRRPPTIWIRGCTKVTLNLIGRRGCELRFQTPGRRTDSRPRSLTVEAVLEPINILSTVVKKSRVTSPAVRLSYLKLYEDDVLNE